MRKSGSRQGSKAPSSKSQKRPPVEDWEKLISWSGSPSPSRGPSRQNTGQCSRASSGSRHGSKAPSQQRHGSIQYIEQPIDWRAGPSPGPSRQNTGQRSGAPSEQRQQSPPVGGPNGWMGLIDWTGGGSPSPRPSRQNTGQGTLTPARRGTPQPFPARSSPFSTSYGSPRVSRSPAAPSPIPSSSGNTHVSKSPPTPHAGKREGRPLDIKDQESFNTFLKHNPAWGTSRKTSKPKSQLVMEKLARTQDWPESLEGCDKKHPRYRLYEIQSKQASRFKSRAKRRAYDREHPPHTREPDCRLKHNQRCRNYRERKKAEEWTAKGGLPCSNCSLPGNNASKCGGPTGIKKKDPCMACQEVYKDPKVAREKCSFCSGK